MSEITKINPNIEYSLYDLEIFFGRENEKLKKQKKDKIIIDNDFIDRNYYEMVLSNLADLLLNFFTENNNTLNNNILYNFYNEYKNQIKNKNEIIIDLNDDRYKRIRAELNKLTSGSQKDIKYKNIIFRYKQDENPKKRELIIKKNNF
tara:strand:- start:96 stop:539 length:444 start_codon:yes stop_codon:yes gene_type:complete